MSIDTLAATVFALLVGIALGWLLCLARGQQRASSGDQEVARLRAILDAEHAAERGRALEQSRSDERLRETFGDLSAEALRRNNESFLALAESRLGSVRTAADADLARRQQAITTLIDPLRETLGKVESQLQEAERGRAGSQATLSEQITAMRATSEQLRTETAQLVTALRAPQVRGRWGEMQLERAVEAAGMSEHIDFITQASSTTDDGTLRPDLVVRLVGGKNVVVDSKVAFSAYLEAMEARDEKTRDNRLKAHARQVRAHIDALAAKSYWQRFAPTPEFVVCFIPADAFLDAALREDPTLLEHAFDRDVVLATPSTLVALLRTIAYTWRQDALAANAAEVHQLGRDLYQRLGTLGAHVDRLGRALDTAVGSYNQTVASLESRVLVTARKLNDLQVVAAGQLLIAPEQLTATTRTTQAPELTESRVVPMSGASDTGAAGTDTRRTDDAMRAG
jgi:DNA recombination protein RmuC